MLQRLERSRSFGDPRSSSEAPDAAPRRVRSRSFGDVDDIGVMKGARPLGGTLGRLPRIASGETLDALDGSFDMPPPRKCYSMELPRAAHSAPGANGGASATASGPRGGGAGDAQAVPRELAAAGGVCDWPPADGGRSRHSAVSGRSSQSDTLRIFAMSNCARQHLREAQSSMSRHRGDAGAASAAGLAQADGPRDHSPLANARDAAAPPCDGAVALTHGNGAEPAPCLPAAGELCAGSEPRPDVTLLVVDVVDFAHLASLLDRRAIGELLHDLFSRYDAACVELGGCRVHTSGGCYLACMGAW